MFYRAIGKMLGNISAEVRTFLSTEISRLKLLENDCDELMGIMHFHILMWKFQRDATLIVDPKLYYQIPGVLIDGTFLCEACRRVESSDFHVKNCFLNKLYGSQRKVLDEICEMCKGIKSEIDVDCIAELSKIVNTLCDAVEVGIHEIFAQKAARD